MCSDDSEDREYGYQLDKMRALADEAAAATKQSPSNANTGALILFEQIRMYADAITILCQEGCGNQAFPTLRTVFELTICLTYLAQQDEEQRELLDQIYRDSVVEFKAALTELEQQMGTDEDVEEEKSGYWLKQLRELKRQAGISENSRRLWGVTKTDLANMTFGEPLGRYLYKFLSGPSHGEVSSTMILFDFEGDELVGSAPRNRHAARVVTFLTIFMHEAMTAIDEIFDLGGQFAERSAEIPDTSFVLDQS